MIKAILPHELCKLSFVYKTKQKNCERFQKLMKDYEIGQWIKSLFE